MKFIADLDVNNNSHFVYSFPCASETGGWSDNLRATSDGFVFIRLTRRWNLEERAAMVAALDRELTTAFGHGIAAVTCAASDCINDLLDKDGLKNFFAAVKESVPQATTIYHGTLRDNAGAENTIDPLCEDNPSALAAILGNPAKGNISTKDWWEETEPGLIELVARAQNIVEAQLGYQLEGERPLGESPDSMQVIRSMTARQQMQRRTVLPTAKL